MQGYVGGGISSSPLGFSQGLVHLALKVGSMEHDVPWKGSSPVFTLTKPQKNRTALWKVNTHLERAAFDHVSAHQILDHVSTALVSLRN